jgi:antitoxin (DNA-binding transcriptional repressor) of toxin-antitoxin stability system
VLDDVEAGETYHVTRNGTEIAEVRPLNARRRFVPVEELQRKWGNAPRIDAAQMRAEADEFFGTEDRLEDDRDRRADT